MTVQARRLQPVEAQDEHPIQAKKEEMSQSTSPVAHAPGTKLEKKEEHPEEHQGPFLKTPSSGSKRDQEIKDQEMLHLTKLRAEAKAGDTKAREEIMAIARAAQHK